MHPSWGAAQERIVADGDLITSDGELNERYAEAQISGTALVGVVSTEKSTQPKPTLTAAIPPDWQGHKICVRLVSSDGRYTATQKYEVSPRWRGNDATLVFASQYGDKINELDPLDMAVLVTKDSCEAGAELAVGSWNGQLGGGITLQVNSFGADHVYIFAGASPSELYCQPVSYGTHLAYDFICSIPSASLATNGVLSVEIDRIRQGQFDEPILISVATSRGKP